MSGVIDKRIVEMVFDNVGFEKNANTTLETLNKLKEALQFDKAISGLDKLSNSAKNAGMDALANGVYAVQDKFSALDIVATRVIQNITDKVQNLVTSTLKKVTLEPLQSGLEEYTTQIDAIQTILANTSDALKEKGLETEHSRIEKINGVLDDLNHYADMTIYNFTEMTKNIGTFTAAGVELDTAATSIKGIANLAAMSGASSADASRAMYQLSQAIASGTVKLQDWNSVVNANMGGKLFQNELIDTAKAMGVVDEQFEKLKNGTMTFRESLSSGWISSEVLTNTLEKFTAGSEGYTKKQIENMQKLWKARGYSDTQIKELTGSIHQLTETEEDEVRSKWHDKGFNDEQIEHIMNMGTAATDAATKVKTFGQLIDTVKEAMQSGWTQSWEYIFGDFEQAKMFWTEISDIMQMFIGRSANARNDMLAVWSKAKYSYNEDMELIDAETGELIEGQKMLADQMGGRELVIQGLRNTFQSLFEVYEQFNKAWDENFWGKTNKNLEDLSLNGEKLKKMSRNFYDFTQAFKDSFGTADEPTKKLTGLRETFDAFARNSRRILRGLEFFGDGVKNVFGSLFKSDIFSKDTLDSLNTFFSGISYRFKDVGKFFRDNFANITGTDNDKNTKGLTDFFNGLKDSFETIALIKFDTITFGFDALAKVFDSFIPKGETIATLMGKVGQGVSDFFNMIHDSFYKEDIIKIQDLFDLLSDKVIGFKQRFSPEATDFSGLFVGINNLKKVISDNDFNIAFTIFGNLVRTIVNVFEALASVIVPVASAFSTVFGPTLGDIVLVFKDLSKRVEELTARFVLSKDQISGVKTLFEGIFTVVKAVAYIIKDVFLGAWDGLGNIFKNLLPSGKSTADMMTNIGNALKDFGEYLMTFTKGNGEVKSFGDFIAGLGDKIGTFISQLKNIGSVKVFGNALSDLFAKFKEMAFGSADISLFDGIVQKLKAFIDGVKNAFMGDNGFDIGDIFSAGGLAYGLNKFFMLIKDIAQIFNGGEDLPIIGTIKEVGEAIAGVCESLQQRVKASAITQIGIALLAIAGAMTLLSMIDKDALERSVGALWAIMGSITAMLSIISQMKGLNDVDVMAAAQALKSMAIAILLLSVAAEILGTMKPEDLAKGIGAVIVLIMALVKVVKDLSKNEKRMQKGIAGLIFLAIAVDMLCIAVKSLAKLSWRQLEKGLLGTIGLIFALTEAASRIGSDFSFGDGAGLLLMASAIKILAGAVTELGQLDWQQLVVGMVGVLGMLGAVAAIMAQMGKSMKGSQALALGASLLIVAVGLKVMADAIKDLSDIEYDKLQNGIAGLVIGLLAMAGAIAIVNQFGSVGAGLTLAVLCVALLGLAGALKIISEIPIPGLVAGIAAIAAVLLILGGLSALLSGLIVPMLGLAAAMALLGVAALAFGVGLLAISTAVAGGGTLIIAFLRECIMLIPELAVQIAEAFMQIITTVVDTITQNMQTIINAAMEMILAFINGLAQAIVTYGPQLAEAVGNLVNAFLQFMENEGPKLIEAGGKLVKWVAEGLGTLWENIKTKAGELVTTAKEAIENKADELKHAGAKLVVSFIRGLAEDISGIGTAATNMARNAIDFLTGGLGEHSPSTEAETAGYNFVEGFLLGVNRNDEVASGVDGIVQTILTTFGALKDNNVVADIANGMFNQMGSITEASTMLVEIIMTTIVGAYNRFFNAAVNLIVQIVTGFMATMGRVLNAAQTILNSTVGTILSYAGRFMSAGSNALSSFVSGILSNAGRAASAGATLASNAVNGVANNLGGMFSAGSNAVSGFVNGLLSGGGRIWSAAVSMANQAMNAVKSALGINSPSKEMMKIGDGFVEGFEIGIQDRMEKAAKQVASFAGVMLDVMSETASESITPTITPVLDTSSLDTKVHDLDSVFSISGNVNNVVTVDYTRDMIDALTSSNTAGFGSLERALKNVLDYDRLGVAVASAVSDMYVKVDGHEIIGYIANEVATGSAMYGMS